MALPYALSSTLAAKARAPIVFNPSFNVIFSHLPASENAPSLIFFALDGMFSCFICSQYLNAYSSISRSTPSFSFVC